MRLPQFSTPCDPNNYCESSLFMAKATTHTSKTELQIRTVPVSYARVFIVADVRPCSVVENTELKHNVFEPR